MAKVKLRSGGGGGDFKQPEKGTYPVTIVHAVDIGTQPDDVIKGNGPNAGKPVLGGPRLMFNFELVGHDEESEYPTTLLKEINLTTGEGSNLFALVKAFLGLDYSQFAKLKASGELDLDLFLGKTALAVVGLSGSGKARLEGFASLPRGMKVTEPRTDLVSFSVDDISDTELSKLPKLIQDKIAQSAERKEGGLSTGASVSGNLDL